MSKPSSDYRPIAGFQDLFDRKEIRWFPKPILSPAWQKRELGDKHAVRGLLCFIDDKKKYVDPAITGEKSSILGRLGFWMKVWWWWWLYGSRLRLAWIVHDEVCGSHKVQPRSLLICIQPLTPSGDVDAPGDLLFVDIKYQVADPEKYVKYMLFDACRRCATGYEVDQALAGIIRRFVEEKLKAVERDPQHPGDILAERSKVIQAILAPQTDITLQTGFDADYTFHNELMERFYAVAGIKVIEPLTYFGHESDTSLDLLALCTQAGVFEAHATQHESLIERLSGWVRADDQARREQPALIRKLSAGVQDVLQVRERTRIQVADEQQPASQHQPGGQWWIWRLFTWILSAIIGAFLVINESPPFNAIILEVNASTYDKLILIGPPFLEIVGFVQKLMIIFLFGIFVLTTREQRKHDLKGFSINPDKQRDRLRKQLQREIIRREKDVKVVNVTNSDYTRNLRELAEIYVLRWLLESPANRNAYFEDLYTFLKLKGATISVLLFSNASQLPELTTMKNTAGNGVIDCQLSLHTTTSQTITLGVEPDTAYGKPLLLRISNVLFRSGHSDCAPMTIWLRAKGPFTLKMRSLATAQQKSDRAYELSPLTATATANRATAQQIAHRAYELTLNRVYPIAIQQSDSFQKSELQLIEYRYRCFWVLDDSLDVSERGQLVENLRQFANNIRQDGITIDHCVLLCIDPVHWLTHEDSPDGPVRNLSAELATYDLEPQLQCFQQAPQCVVHDGELPWECGLEAVVHHCERLESDSIRVFVALIGGWGPHRPLNPREWNEGFNVKAEEAEPESDLRVWQRKRRREYARFVVKPTLDWRKQLKRLREMQRMLIITGWRHQHALEHEPHFDYLLDLYNDFWEEVCQPSRSDSLDGMLARVRSELAADHHRVVFDRQSRYVIPVVIDDREGSNV